MILKGKIFGSRRKQPQIKIDECFSSRQEWLAFLNENPHLLDLKKVEAAAERIMRNGFLEPLSESRVDPKEIAPLVSNLREELLARGLNARMRASLMVVAHHLREHHPNVVRIFATEAVTSMAQRLRAVYPKFLGSEYAADEATKKALYPIPHQDLMALTLPRDSFDFVTTNEVLEHVPDIDQALREMARVLRPGGWHIGTHPFHCMQEEGDVRSQLVDGKVVHLKEPEIHGNPVDPSGGSLVFETPGWNVLERARAAGFSQAYMRLVADERYGAISEMTGVFVLCLQK